MPRDRFVTAGAAWLGVRCGRVDPAPCGLSAAGITGAWFVAARVVRDLAGLNKREMLPWDYWDYWGTVRDLRPAVALPVATAARIDSRAALIVIGAEDRDLRTPRDNYGREDGFRVPRVVTSFPKGGPVEVLVGWGL